MLNQNCSDNKDGMDMALCRFDRKKGGVFDSLKYAGAKNSLFIRRTDDTEYHVVKGDRHSIAGGVKYGADFAAKPFTLHEFKISPGDIIYMTTDGITDMCGSDRKRFSRNRFTGLLNRIYPLDMECQAAEIEKTITSYSTGAEQRDDISVLGLKILNAKN
jgi:serine phosphatase RsbU (regulator of sigma subunit)